MTLHPSLSLRKRAAELHEEMTRAEDVFREASDVGEELAVLGWLSQVANESRGVYGSFCLHYQFKLTSDASGLCLYCKDTGIPLVVGDDVEDVGNGELRLRVREVA